MHNMKRLLVVLAVSVALAASAVAATRTVTLDVPGMNCAACAITLNKALKKISGVEKVDVKLKLKQIELSYDDAKTDVSALIKTTTDAGYPSHEKKAAE